MTLTMLNIGNMRYDHQPIDVRDWLYTYDRLMYYYYYLLLLLLFIIIIIIYIHIYITLYNQSYDH